VRVTRWLLGSLAVIFVVAGVGLAYVSSRTPLLRDRVLDALNERFASQVALESLQITAFPQPKLSGSKVELRHNGRTDVPPLISIREFSGTAGLAGLLGSPLHLRSVNLDGMTIQIPPGGVKTGSTSAQHEGGRRRTLIIDRITAAPVWLEIASKNPLKPPRVFDIHQLTLQDFRPDAPARFRASLTNAIPAGEIVTDGRFGPYVAADPEQTAIAGRFTLADAQLDDIKGLGGTLSAKGNYDGTLERLLVSGETHSPDFSIDVAHRGVPLDTTFTAEVDATNGDTLLDQVHATLINTIIEASGAVVRAREVKGRHVSLDVEVKDGHIEDLLRLAVKPARGPLTGVVGVKAKLVVPAGDQDVIDRMELTGSFTLSQAKFTSFNVQKRLNVLSKRARGDDGDDAAASVVSNMSGRFALRNATITFSHLTFSVPGARVELAGSYALHPETMDFKGNLLLDASLADTTSGLKAFAARIVQPLFRRPGGGSKLPIKVQGTREKPEFGLDVRRAFLPG
jgi:hypothetical protein